MNPLGVLGSCHAVATHELCDPPHITPPHNQVLGHRQVSQQVHEVQDPVRKWLMEERKDKLWFKIPLSLKNGKYFKSIFLFMLAKLLDVMITVISWNKPIF